MRAGKKVLVLPKRPASIMLNEAIVPDVSDCPSTVSGYVQYLLCSSTSLAICVFIKLELLTN